VYETSALHVQVYMILTHGKIFTVQKVLYKIKLLGCIILKMKV